MTSYKPLIEIQDRALNNRPKEWRYGQAVFNYAYEVFPVEVDKIRGTEFDCFHNNNKVTDFLKALYYKLLPEKLNNAIE